VTATGAISVTQSFDVQPGMSTTLNLQGLPTGTVRFTGNAYAGLCSEVPIGAVATWFSAPTLATVDTAPVFVELIMQQTGSATVGVDFQGTCRSPGAPCISGSECCSNFCANNTCTGPGMCPPGTSACGTGCFNLMSDPHNCGFCGQMCPPGLSCTQG
jgi:hypothetical protein